MNLDSLTRRELISFERELAHVQGYLSLEKMRFEDELNVEYRIESLRGMLPPLTVQPLVENAVRHGVAKKEGGGTVSISSFENEDAFYVVIKDDGVGFDPDAPQKDDRTHVGIQNVRNRLAAQCGGRLEIRSAPGAGTSATIILPKKAAGNKHGVPQRCSCRPYTAWPIPFRRDVLTIKRAQGCLHKILQFVFPPGRFRQKVAMGHNGTGPRFSGYSFHKKAALKGIGAGRAFLCFKGLCQAFVGPGSQRLPFIGQRRRPNKISIDVGRNLRGVFTGSTPSVPGNRSLHHSPSQPALPGRSGPHSPVPLRRPFLSGYCYFLIFAMASFLS